MSSIDKRIVDMQFNNAQFEAGIKSSLDALEKLKAGLKLDGATKGMTIVEQAGKKFNLDGVKKAVDTASIRFEQFSKSGTSTFNNIKNAASEFGAHVSAIFDKFRSTKDTVISAKFDNKQFESGVHTSAQQIDKFTSGAINDLGELDRAAQGFDFSEMAAGIDHIASKFNALTVIGVTALSNITNSVLNTAKTMVSALTIDPIKTGLSEYETKMNAIQTILTNTASKGTTLKDVNATLEELNAYSDKTIYNFAEMAKNIGTFTAAGVDLNVSATAIKGIANLAAGSGSNAQQASTAMYQLSQALAAGSVKLMDWNSVVNAGMGGELFQNALKKTAKGMGIVVDASKPFRETLESGWITSEVLTKTLADFADDPALIKAATQVKTFTQLFDTMKESVQSGWAQSWEKVIGDKDEAAALFTGINDAFGSIAGASATARNATLSFWKANGGRAAIIAGLTAAFHNLQAVLKPIGEAFREVFPAVTGKMLVELSEKFKVLMTSFKMGETTASNIKSTFKGFFAMLDIGKQFLMAFAKGVLSVVRGMAPIGSSILGLTASFGDYLVTVDNMVKQTGIFKAVFAGISSVLIGFANVISGIVGTIGELFGSLFNLDSGGMDNAAKELNGKLKPFDTFKARFKEIFDGLAESVGRISPVFNELGKAVGSVLKTAADYVAGLLNSFDSNTLLAIVNGTFFVMLAKGLKSFTAPLEDIAKTGSGFIKTVTGVLDEVRKSLTAYQTNLKANVLFKIAAAIGILATSLLVLSGIDPERLTNALAAITIMFGELFATMFAFEKTAGLIGLGPLAAISAYFIGLSTALLILANAMKVVASLDWEGVQKGLVGVGGLVAMLTIAAKAMTTYGGITKGLGQLILFAAAISILANVVKRLGEMDLAQIGKGLLGIGVLMLEIGLFMKYAEMSGMSVRGALALVGVATAISILAVSIEQLGSMDVVKLKQGLGAIGIVLAELALFTLATGNAKTLLGTSAGLILVGVAVNILAMALGKMSAIAPEKLSVGLQAMGGALAIVAAAMWLMPPTMLGSSVALVAVSAAINLLTNALLALSEMTWGEVGTGLVALGGAMTVIAAAMYGMAGALPGAAALVVVSGALMTIVPVIKILGSIPIQAIGIALVALAGTFAVIGIAGLVLSPLAPTLVILAAAIALLGVACLAVGAGLTGFAAGLGALIAVASTGVTSVISIFKALIELIPYTLKKFGEGVIELAKVISVGAPTIAKAFVDVILSAITALTKVIPTLIKTLTDLVTAVLDALVSALPKLIDTGAALIMAIIKGLIKMIPELVDAAFGMIVSFVNGLAAAIRKNTDPMIAAMSNLINAMIESGKKVFVAAIGAYKTVGKQVVDGFIEGVKSKITEAATWTANLASATLEAAKKVLGIHSPSKKFDEEVGQMIAEGLIKGVKKKETKAAQAAADMAKKVFDASVAWIDDRKYYNEMALNDELSSWEYIQTKYKEGTEERKKADREVYRLRQAIAKADMDYTNNVLKVQKDANAQRLALEDEYYDKTKSINEKLKNDIQNVSNAYKDALKSRTSELAGASGIFDKVGEQEPVTGTELLDNLKGQVEQFSSWQSSLDALSGRGLSDNLIKEFEKMGPQSAAQLEALNQMSDSQLSEYVSLWDTKYAMAHEQAVGELEQMRIDSLDQIEQLKNDAMTELDEYRDGWLERMQQLKVNTASELEKLKIDWLAQIGTVKSDTEKQFLAMTENIQKTVMAADWSGLGQNLVEGIKGGIMSKAQEVAEAAAKVVRDAIRAANEEADINSPSRETAKTGRYMAEGIAVGLRNFAGVVSTAAQGVAGTAISALQTALSNISTLVDAGLDVQPVIRPVLDLTDVTNGSKQITSLLSKGNGLNLGTISAKVPSIVQNGSNQQMVNQQAVAPASIQLTQNNYSPKALSRLDIYRQTRNQFSVLKGVVNGL